jgi:membrane-associated phospholipid phosphatase
MAFAQRDAKGSPMKVLLLTVMLCRMYGQTAPPAPADAPQTQQAQPQGQADRSVIQPKPAGKVIKSKDLWEKTGYFHPFNRMPKYILADQKAIWTSPFHTAKRNAKWWLIFGGATGALIATDKRTVRELPNTSGQVRLGTYTSHIGAAYSLIPLSASFYFLGTAFKSERFRETGMLAFETLIDTTLVELVIKSATDRARPLESDGKGHFWDSSGGPWNASFPSGHAINTWGLASVFAHQYRHTIYVPIIAYALAGTVVGARVSARKHFPGDVVSGAVMGWFIGDYVYGKRHNEDLDAKPSLAHKLLSHVRFNVSFQ